jgi:fatty acid desaturase
MTYILTNHSLSPLTDVNDPLLNSLSVTAPRFVEILHLNFGYHVEHHIFPSMSSRHAPALRRTLRLRYPHRYQSMTLGRALLCLFRTPRVYKDSVTLLDPRSGFEAATLQPRR